MSVVKCTPGRKTTSRPASGVNTPRTGKREKSLNPDSSNKNEGMPSTVKRAQQEPAAYRKGFEYRAHKEELRRQSELAELSALRPPRINPTSSNQTPRSGKDTASRLHAYAAAASLKRELKKQELEEAALVECTASPAINSVSRNLGDRTEARARWERQRRAHLLCRQEEAAQRQRASSLPRPGDLDYDPQLTLSPRICPTSKLLVAATGRAELPVTERLFAAAADREQKRNYLRHVAMTAQEVEAIPLISHTASKLQRGEPSEVFDRLFADAAQHPSHVLHGDVESSDGSSSEALEEEDPLELARHPCARLYHRGLLWKKSNKQRIQDLRYQQRIRFLHSHPKATVTPTVLAFLESRAEQPLYARISKPLHSLRNPAPPDKNLTFHPKIHSSAQDAMAPEQAGRRYQTMADFADAMAAKKQFRQKQLEKKAAELEAAALSKCKPTPFHGTEHGKSLASMGKRLAPEDFYHRGNHWKASVQATRAAKSKLVDIRALQDCTFAPDLNKSRNGMKPMFDVPTDYVPPCGIESSRVSKTAGGVPIALSSVEVPLSAVAIMPPNVERNSEPEWTGPWGTTSSSAPVQPNGPSYAALYPAGARPSDSAPYPVVRQKDLNLPGSGFAGNPSAPPTAYLLSRTGIPAPLPLASNGAVVSEAVIDLALVEDTSDQGSSEHGNVKQSMCATPATISAAPVSKNELHSKLQNSIHALNNPSPDGPASAIHVNSITPIQPQLKATKDYVVPAVLGRQVNRIAKERAEVLADSAQYGNSTGNVGDLHNVSVHGDTSGHTINLLQRLQGHCSADTQQFLQRILSSSDLNRRT